MRLYLLNTMIDVHKSIVVSGNPDGYHLSSYDLDAVNLAPAPIPLPPMGYFALKR